MTEIRLFVEPNASISNKCIIAQGTADELGISNGEMVSLKDPDSNSVISCSVEIDSGMLDFSIKVASDVLGNMGFNGIELNLLKGIVEKKLDVPKPTVPLMPEPSAPMIQPSAPTPGAIGGIPQLPSRPSSMGVPPPPSGLSGPPPSMGVPPPSMGVPPPITIAKPIDPYPNKIDPSLLLSQKTGSILLTVKKTNDIDGRVKMNPQDVTNLGLTHGMLLGWECSLTRTTGSARITVDPAINMGMIKIGSESLEDTNTKSDQLVVFSTEPPITHEDVITLNIISQADLDGYVVLNPRNAATLSAQVGDVLAFEDNLTGAMGAAKFRIQENLSNEDVLIDAELLEASGIGSTEVDLKKNIRQIIPLQSIELGISPIQGEDIWSIISMARQNINSIKSWLSKYIIFKGIKLRWEAANISCEVLNTTPDLMGDVFAEITQNTTLTLKPVGLITFNAILIIDISRSMMARDVEVKNIGPALEGIKAAMHAPEIKDFLSKFKPGIYVPRRWAAAFGAILFLSEKVGRGFGEKVSIIRFADEAQALTFGPENKPFMDSSAGEKDALESAAKKIVDEIGNAYGQSTNMGLAMIKAQELLFEFGEDAETMPTMIVMLTDGIPTDGDQYLQAIKMFSANPNVVLYIIGLGNPDDKAMRDAASVCGGEYFKPEDSGELLIWYSKRARDLQVKLKGSDQQ